MLEKKAISAIEKHGILLVYPINNKPEPHSIWSVLYPNTKMLWEWNDDGDDRVAKLWHLKTELSTTKKVVYAKWFRGRATYFSREVFTALLSVMGSTQMDLSRYSPEAKLILDTLRMDSPLSTKQIKTMTDLKGKFFASTYDKATKSLWQKLLIVGFGEVEDGAFPSLAMGATETLYEDLWNKARDLDPKKARLTLLKVLGEDSIFLKKGVFSS